MIIVFFLFLILKIDMHFDAFVNDEDIIIRNVPPHYDAEEHEATANCDHNNSKVLNNA